MEFDFFQYYSEELKKDKTTPSSISSIDTVSGGGLSENSDA
jgi:hypothetical protein